MIHYYGSLLIFVTLNILSYFGFDFTLRSSGLVDENGSTIYLFLFMRPPCYLDVHRLNCLIDQVDNFGVLLSPSYYKSIFMHTYIRSNECLGCREQAFT
jgi:hypothetical protein